MSEMMWWTLGAAAAAAYLARAWKLRNDMRRRISNAYGPLLWEQPSVRRMTHKRVLLWIIPQRVYHWRLARWGRKLQRLETAAERGE